MLRLIKGAARTYSAVSGAVGTALHPLDAVRGAARDLLVTGVVKVVVVCAGDRMAQQLKRRVEQDYRFALSVEVPSLARKHLLDEEFLAAVTAAVNDGLAAPLALLGLRVGAVHLAPNAEAGTVRIEGCFGLTDQAAGAAIENARDQVGCVPA